MSKTKTYLVLPNSFGVEPGVYEAVYDDSLRSTFRSAPQLCKRMTSSCAQISAFRRRTLEKASALGCRCWYCSRVMNPVTIGAQDSVEMEHQLPRSSGHIAVEHPANTVAACRQCNNSAHPGKGERTLEQFRAFLTNHHGVQRVVFFGEVLRWLRTHAQSLHLNLPLDVQGAEKVLAWYRRSPDLKLHFWDDSGDDYKEGLCLRIPPDGTSFPLGVPQNYWTVGEKSLGLTEVL